MGIEDKVSGRVKQAAGSLTGSEALRREGVDDERRGEVKEEAAREQEAADRQQERADEKSREADRLKHGGGGREEKSREADRLEHGGGGREPIPGYDDLNADEAIHQLDGLSDSELREVEDYERRNQDRKTVLQAIESRRA